MSIKMPNEFYQLLGGLSLLVASVVTRITCYEDDENPDGFPSTFMYIPVVYWTHIYAVLGMIVIADAAITYYKLM